MKLIEKAHAIVYDFDFIKLDYQTGDINLLVSGIVSVILFIAGVAAIIYLIYSGILYISAAGNPDAAKKGQQGIINAVIGIIIIVLAYVVATAVANYARTI